MRFIKGSVDDAKRASLPPDYTSFFRAAQVWAWMICVLGCMGNLLTLAAGTHQLFLMKRRRNHAERCRATPAIRLQADTILLLHLSFCDLLYCAINLPIIAVNYELALSGALPSTYPSEQYCTATVVFRYLNAIIEWMTLGLLALERCLDMNRIRTNRIFTPIKTCFLLACCWGGALILQLGSIISSDQYVFDNITYKCDMRNSGYKIFFYMLETPLPCCLILAGAASIIWQMWNNKRRLIAVNMPQELVERRSRSMWRSTGLVLCLLTLFLLCVIPNAVYNVLSIFIPDAADNIPAALVIFMLYWVQYGINFIFYGAGNNSFRQAYIQFLTAVWNALCCWCRLPAPWHRKTSRTLSSSWDATDWRGYITFLSSSSVEFMDTPETTTSTLKGEDVWNTPSNKLMSCLRVGSLKHSYSASSFSSSSLSLSSSSSPFSSRTVSFSSWT